MPFPGSALVASEACDRVLQALDDVRGRGAPYGSNFGPIMPFLPIPEKRSQPFKPWDSNPRRCETCRTRRFRAGALPFGPGYALRLIFGKDFGE